MKRENLTVKSLESVVKELLMSDTEERNRIYYDSQFTLNRAISLSQINRLCLSNAVSEKKLTSREWFTMDYLKRNRMFPKHGEKATYIESWFYQLDRNRFDSQQEYEETLKKCNVFARLQYAYELFPVYSQGNSFTSKQLAFLVNEGVYRKDQFKMCFRNTPVFNGDQIEGYRTDVRHRAGEPEYVDRYMDDIVVQFLKDRDMPVSDVSGIYDMSAVRQTLGSYIEEKYLSDKSDESKSDDTVSIKNALAYRLVFDELNLNVPEEKKAELQSAGKKLEELLLKSSNRTNLLRNIIKGTGNILNSFNKDFNMDAFRSSCYGMDEYIRKNSSVLNALEKDNEFLRIGFVVSDFGYALKLNIDEQENSTCRLTLTKSDLSDAFHENLLAAVHSAVTDEFKINNGIDSETAERLESLSEYCEKKVPFLKLSKMLSKNPEIDADYDRNGITLNVPVYTKKNAAKLSLHDVLQFEDGSFEDPEGNILSLSTQYLEVHYDCYDRYRNIYINGEPVFEASLKKRGLYDCDVVLKGADSQYDAEQYLSQKFGDREFMETDKKIRNFSIRFTENDIIHEQLFHIVSELRKYNGSDVCRCTQDSCTRIADILSLADRNFRIIEKNTADQVSHSPELDEILNHNPADASYEIIRKEYAEFKNNVLKMCLNDQQYVSSSADVKSFLYDASITMQLQKIYFSQPSLFRAFSLFHMNEKEIQEHEDNLHDLNSVLEKLNSSCHMDSFCSGIINSEPNNNISSRSVRFNEEIRMAAIECITYDQSRRMPAVDMTRFEEKLKDFRNQVSNLIHTEKDRLESIKNSFNTIDFAVLADDIMKKQNERTATLEM